MTRRSLHVLAVLLAVCAAGVALVAQDWPQFLGPQRNGMYTGPPLADSWPVGGPTISPFFATTRPPLMVATGQPVASKPS